MLQIKTFEEYLTYYNQSLESPNEFWSSIADTFSWKKKWDKVQSGDFENLNVKWFEGAKLNITENCLDRHLEKNGDKVAIYFEPNDPNSKAISYTYKELHEEVCRFANALESIGAKKGDRICFYMSMIPQLLIGVLACARIGAIHSVVFAGFSAKSLSDRINDSKCRFVLTNNEGLRGKKSILLKDIVDKALEHTDCVDKVIVYSHTDTKVEMISGRDLDWNELIQNQNSSHDAAVMDAEDILFILYTSGSTGKPKGLQHSIAGYMVYTAFSFKNVFQYNDEDVFWCTADIGWITGHSYLTYGPLLNGATQVMFEGIPTYPDAARFWAVCDKYKVTHFYTAPTAIRALQNTDQSLIDNYKLDSLKVLGSVGEPINEEAWEWYNEKIGKGNCPIVDTWWQTETGGIMISPLAGITKTKPSYATYPLPGVSVVLVNSDGDVLGENATSGNLCIDKPWPSMARSIYGDHDRYKQTYFSTYKNKYFTGDGCKRDEEGLYRITGRVDDVINVSGHRLGTAEIEDAIDQHENVVETAVVGYPHEIKGQGIYAYVICYVMPSNPSVMRKEILDYVIKQIGPIAKPDHIVFVEGLPKTRSGKIMRRILRKIAASEEDQLGDTSTLLDPSIVDQIILAVKSQ